MKNRWKVKHISDDDCRRAARIAWTRRLIFHDRQWYGPEPYQTPQVLAEITGAPLKVCYRKLEKMNDRGLMDYGLNIEGTWWNEDLGTYSAEDDPHWSSS